ncbi:MAG: hypothetical protein JNM21_02590 [Taibaiella sp.]|nr:hypothetical protein [Taibaiella sp.]
MSGTYEYAVPAVGRSQIVFKPGKQFEYIINHKSGTGSYKKRGKKYYLNFKGGDKDLLSGHFVELLEKKEIKSDTNQLKIHVFDNIEFAPFFAEIVVKDVKNDTVIFHGFVDPDSVKNLKLPNNIDEVYLTVAYSFDCTAFSGMFKIHQNMTINVYLSCIVFNQITDGCLGYQETDKLTLKIRQKDENEIWIRYPQARSKYIKFTKTD